MYFTSLVIAFIKNTNQAHVQGTETTKSGDMNNQYTLTSLTFFLLLLIKQSQKFDFWHV